jgi:hypothetical protein
MWPPAIYCPIYSTASSTCVAHVRPGKTPLTGFYVGQNSDDVFLTPNVTRDRTCGVLKIIPSKDIATISLTRAQAIRVDKDQAGCT